MLVKKLVFDRINKSIIKGIFRVTVNVHEDQLISGILKSLSTFGA